jgi:hypothetical protein
MVDAALGAAGGAVNGLLAGLVVLALAVLVSPARWWTPRPAGRRPPVTAAPRWARSAPDPIERVRRRFGARPFDRSGAGSLEAALPDLIDRFAVAASAGLPPSAALLAVARQAPEPLAGPLGRAAAQLRSGMPFDRCLDQLGDSLGPGSFGLIGALRDAASRGVPLASQLEAVGHEARDVRRRQVQVRARRLPVALLFPLVLCTLPAAVLVTVVPIVAVALRSLSL